MKKPFMPVEIQRGEIPLLTNGQYPVPYDIKCNLEKGQRYHIFLVGEFVYNKTLGSAGLTDYDIEVYDPYWRLVSRHTESAGQPEQVANDAKHQYFVPSMDGRYTFRIYNDPKDSQGEDAAVFMLIKHIEMNTKYNVTLYGKARVGDPYPEGFNYAYEFDTPSENFDMVIKVPDPNLKKGYQGLDMYEARVYPMASPSGGIGHYIWGVGVPYGHLLLGESDDNFGGYSTSIEGASMIDYTASCEYSGEDMRVTFGKPEYNVTVPNLNDPTVFYYLVLLAEYDYGTVEFYLKTDYRPLNVTLVNPNTVGYSGRETPVYANVISHHNVDRVWMNYSTDNWKTQKTVEMSETDDGYKGNLPRFNLKDMVKYRVYAQDEVENKGSASAQFEVKDKVDLSASISRTSMYGGESIKVVGTSTLGNTEHVIKFTCGGRVKTITVKTDESGAFECTWVPQWVGKYGITMEYVGDDYHHTAITSGREFTVEKRKFIISSSIERSIAKEKQPFRVSGAINPALGGIPVSIIFVSPTGSLTESCLTTPGGTFSATIVPEELGSWEVLVQIQPAEYYMESQGQLTGFEVAKLTIPETIIFKAQEFTRPPLLYVPVGLVALAAAGVGIKTGFIKSLLSRNKSVKVEEIKEEDPKNVSTYQRRSSRKS